MPAINALENNYGPRCLRTLRAVIAHPIPQCVSSRIDSFQCHDCNSGVFFGEFTYLEMADAASIPPFSENETSVTFAAGDICPTNSSKYGCFSNWYPCTFKYDGMRGRFSRNKLLGWCLQ